MKISFDGDVVSIIYCESKEAIAEAKDFFKTRIAYIQPGGNVAFSIGTQTLKFTLQYMTGEPIKR